MSTVNDARKDILDAGTLTGTGSGDVDSGWITTKDTFSVLVLVAPTGTYTGIYVEESNDQSSILRLTQPATADASGTRYYETITPGAAFLRIVFEGGASGATLNYSVRAVG